MHDSMPDIFETKFRGKKGIMFKILCWEEKLSVWMSDRVICVNQVQKDVAVKRGISPEKIYISMNVPDHKKFKLLKNPAKVGKKDGHFKLVYHGTITKRLGIDLAIEAVAKLEKQIPGIELHIWGGGEYLDFICDQFKELAKNQILFFHKMVPVEELPGALAEMDVGVIPNRKSVATELMLPVKMMEYIALGIPVVAPKLKAIQNYFTEEMVSFFEPDNIDTMAETILKLYQDSSRRKSQGEKAKAFIKQYGWEKQALDFLNFYVGV